MNYKQKTSKLIVLASLSVILLSPTLIHAQTTSTTTSSIKGPRPTTASKSAQLKETAATNLKERALKEIDRRLASLNSLLTRLNEAKKLSSTNKATLTTLIQQNISNLSSLKSTISAITDQTQLKTEVQSIVKDYRVYALVVPQVQLIIATDNVVSATDKLTTLATTLGQKINTEKAAGKDVKELETALVTMQSKTVSAKAQAQRAQELVMSLTPDGYPSNKSSLQTARSQLVAASRDIKSATQAARKIIQGLNLQHKESTPSAKPLKPATSSSTLRGF